jgi:hypothetical protein
MAELDSIPQKQQIEISTVKLDADSFKSINELNNQTNVLLADIGGIYMRRKELNDELARLDSVLENGEEEFKAVQKELKTLLEDIDEKYPQGRVNIQDGTIQYQPGAPTRKQMAEQQAQKAQEAQQAK